MIISTSFIFSLHQTSNPLEPSFWAVRRGLKGSPSLSPRITPFGIKRALSATVLPRPASHLLSSGFLFAHALLACSPRRKRTAEKIPSTGMMVSHIQGSGMISFDCVVKHATVLWYYCVCPLYYVITARTKKGWLWRIEYSIMLPSTRQRI